MEQSLVGKGKMGKARTVDNPSIVYVHVISHRNPHIQVVQIVSIMAFS